MPVLSDEAMHSRYGFLQLPGGSRTMGLCLQPNKDPRKIPSCTPAPFWICCFQQISLQMESRRKDWPEYDDLLSPQSRTIMLVYNVETIVIIIVIIIDESLEHGLLEISRSYCSSRSIVSKRQCGEARRPASNCSKLSAASRR